MIILFFSLFFHDFLLFHLLFSSLVSYMSLFIFSFSSFLFSLFSFLLHLLFLSFTAHTETRSTRQVTPPTKNGHAPRDPLTHWRAINCQSLLCHILGSFHVLSQFRPQAPLLVEPIRPCLIFMLNVLSALPGFDPAFLKRYCV